jgi:hypothetical protein
MRKIPRKDKGEGVRENEWERDQTIYNSTINLPSTETKPMLNKNANTFCSIGKAHCKIFDEIVKLKVIFIKRD